MLPNPVSATTLVAQPTYDTTTGMVDSDNSGFQYFQKLGTGLTGTVEQVSVRVGFDVTPTHDWAVSIFQCDNDASAPSICTNSTEVWQGRIYAGASTEMSTRFINMATEFEDEDYDGDLYPDKYYFLTIQKLWADAEQFELAGTAGDTYAAGNCARRAGGGNLSCPNITDMYFIITGVQTATDSSYVSNLQPSMGSTTASTQVRLSMDYHAVASHNITSYSFILRDTIASINGSSTPILISGSASSGDNSIARTVTLTSGKLYSLQGYICSADNTCYSGAPANSFSVVTDFDTIHDQYFTDYGGIVATSSSEWYQTIPLISLFVSKVPFGYLYQIKEIWDEQEASGSNFPLIELNLSDLELGSTTPVGSFLPDIEVSTSTMMEYFPTPIFTGFLALQTTSYWAFFAFYLWNRGRRFIELKTT